VESQTPPTLNVNQETASSPTSPVTPKQTSLLIILGLSLIIFVILTGFLAYQNAQLQKRIIKLQSSSLNTTSSTPVPSTTPMSQTNTQTQTIALPVKILQTGYGAGPQNQTYPYPASVDVSVPQGFSSPLGAYGVADMVVVGPNEWTGIGQVGDDGSTDIGLYPVGGSPTSGPSISISNGGGCVGCTYDFAAPYFPEVRQSEPQVMSISSDLVPTPPPGIVSNFVTPQLVEYSLPTTSNGMETNGVAYFTKSESAQLSNQPYFIGMQVVLPSSQHVLALQLLNIFIQGQGLNK
jgi:hypothetical protein